MTHQEWITEKEQLRDVYEAERISEDEMYYQENELDDDRAMSCSDEIEAFEHYSLDWAYAIDDFETFASDGMFDGIDNDDIAAMAAKQIYEYMTFDGHCTDVNNGWNYWTRLSEPEADDWRLLNIMSWRIRNEMMSGYIPNGNNFEELL